MDDVRRVAVDRELPEPPPVPVRELVDDRDVADPVLDQRQREQRYPRGEVNARGQPKAREATAGSSAACSAWALSGSEVVMTVAEVPQPSTPVTPAVPDAPVTPAVPDPGTPAQPQEPSPVPAPEEPATPVVPDPGPEVEPQPDPTPGES
jgi:hypothetical protein